MGSSPGFQSCGSSFASVGSVEEVFAMNHAPESHTAKSARGVPQLRHTVFAHTNTCRTTYSFDATSFQLPAGGVFLTGSSVFPVRACLSASAMPGCVVPALRPPGAPVDGSVFSDSCGTCCSCMLGFIINLCSCSDTYVVAQIAPRRACRVSSYRQRTRGGLTVDGALCCRTLKRWTAESVQQ
jgi:hypothetical protein